MKHRVFVDVYVKSATGRRNMSSVRGGRTARVIKWTWSVDAVRRPVISQACAVNMHGHSLGLVSLNRLSVGCGTTP